MNQAEHKELTFAACELHFILWKGWYPVKASIIIQQGHNLVGITLHKHMSCPVVNMWAAVEIYYQNSCQSRSSGMYLVFEVIQDTWRSNMQIPSAYWNATLSCPLMASSCAFSYLVPISFWMLTIPWTCILCWQACISFCSISDESGTFLFLPCSQKMPLLMCFDMSIPREGSGVKTVCRLASLTPLAGSTTRRGAGSQRENFRDPISDHHSLGPWFEERQGD